MAAQLAVRAERAFQIDQRTRPGELEIRPLPALLKQIKSDELELSARRDLHRRQTAAVDRHAVADLHAAPANAGAHGHFNGFFGRRDFFNDARFFDNACEHKK